jgi:hypothetical protein
LLLSGCDNPNCANHPCSDFGGSASQSISVCVTSIDCGVDESCSKKTTYEIKDSTGKELLNCQQTVQVDGS